MLVVGVKSNLGCEAGCGVTVSWSDHARNGLGSAPALEMTFQLFSRNFFEMLESHFCVAGAVFGDVGGCHLLFRAL